MFYRVLADIVLIVHLIFVLFVIFGGLLILRRRWILWFHLPALAWGAAVEFFVLNCPLTDLEKHLRAASGDAVYQGDFIDHYISSILYPQISVETLTVLGVMLIIVNLFIYGYILLYHNRPIANQT